MTEHPPRTTRGAHRAPSRRGGLLAVVAVVVLALVATTVAFLVRRDDGSPSAAEPAGATSGPLADVAGDVAGWVDAELPADTTLGAPDELRTALAAAGVPDDRIAVGDGGALQVVEGEPGAGAVVVARFPGGDGTLLSVVDPRPAEPTAEELDRRRRLSAAVLANPVTGATGRAEEVLRTADVDARLLGLVAVLVARLDAGVADFPPAPGQPEEGTPARRVLVHRAGGEELVPDSVATERVVAFLAVQEPPFEPDAVEVTEDGVLVGFDYVPDPDAVVTAATP